MRARSARLCCSSLGYILILIFLKLLDRHHKARGCYFSLVLFGRKFYFKLLDVWKPADSILLSYELISRGNVCKINIYL